MVAFTNRFDLRVFQECMQYVQDSLDWLVAQESKDRESLFPEETLDQTTKQFEILLRHKLLYMQNSKTTINRLPVELLGRILLYLQDGFIPLYNVSHYYAFPFRSLWPSASLVCRHWRWVILNTPDFWTTLIWPNNAMSCYTDDEWPWSTIGLSRSGALPLTVHFPMRFNALFSQRADVARILNEAPRFKDLRFLDACLDPMEAVISKARDLKVLMVETRHEHMAVTSFDQVYKLPQLQILSMHNCIAWRACATSNLRHMSLLCQNWTVSRVSEFMAVLAHNVRMEELILSCICVLGSDLDSILAFSNLGSPIHMPELKRLVVEDWASVEDGALCPMSTILSKHLILPPGCARSYLLSDFADAYDIFGGQEDLPIQRLFVTPIIIMGTDGASAFLITGGNRDRFIAETINRNNVRELWLRPTGPNSWTTGPVDAICGMRNVVKLFLCGDISFWLKQFQARQSFPMLEELHILRQDTADGQSIIRYLANRRRNGMKTGVLRVVRDAFSFRPTTDQVFRSWKRSSWKFARLVEKAVFEDMARDPRTSVFVPESMELPEVCLLPSPMCPFWSTWSASSL